MRQIDGDDGPALTDRQRDILAFIVRYAVENGRAPSLRDIADEFEFATFTGPVCHLRALARKGLLQMRAGVGAARGLIVVGMETRVADTEAGRRLAREIAATTAGQA